MSHRIPGLAGRVLIRTRATEPIEPATVIVEEAAPSGRIVKNASGKGRTKKATEGAKIKK